MTPPVFVLPPAALEGAAPGSLVRLDGAEGRHAVSVRRLTAGENLDLVDGSGRRARATVVATPDRQTLEARVDGIDIEPPPEPRMVVVQALPKGDRGELAVELLTEVGVDVIVPWSAAHCVTQWKADRRERAHRRWSDAALAAAKQARRARFPSVAALATTGEVADLVRAAACAVVLHETAESPLAGVTVPESGDVVVVVGPEGGLSDEERAVLGAAGAHAVRLGPSVLRTSSAGMAAAAVLLASTRRWAVADGAGMEG